MTNDAASAQVDKRITILAIAGATAFALYELFLGSRLQLFFGDFRAFYCAGAAMLHGHDPYAAASLYGCERAPMPFGLYRALPGIAVPAPLPGYAIAAFAALGALPYVWACVVWGFVLFATAALSTALLARALNRRFIAVLPLFTVGFAALVIPYGELATIEICALLGMALALRANRLGRATIYAAAAMMLPHVGLPAIAAAFVCKKPMRVRLVALAAVLAIVDLLAGGLHGAIGYFAAVLPAHAISEVGSTSQYGLTWALHALGVPDRSAILWGELSYAAMALLGIFIAAALARRDDDVAYLALVPPAFAVFGGSFMHYTEIMAAIPAGALLFSRARGAWRALLLAAIVLLAFPWAWALSQPQLMFAFVVAGATIVRLFGEGDLWTALRTSLASAALAAVIVIAGFYFGTGLDAPTHAVHLDPSLAQASWAEYVRTQRASSGIVWWFAKAPTWVGLALLTWLAFRCSEVYAGSATSRSARTKMGASV